MKRVARAVWDWGWIPLRIGVSIWVVWIAVDFFPDGHWTGGVILLIVGLLYPLLYGAVFIAVLVQKHRQTQC